MRTYKIKHDNSFPWIFLAILIDFELQWIEAPDRRIWTVHEPLVKLWQEIAGSWRETPQKLLEWQERLTNLEVNSANNIHQADHIAKHRSIVVRIVPCPADTPCYIIYLQEY